MIIDLSHPLTEQIPVYPGDPAVKIEFAGLLEKDGYCDHVVTLGTHVGTHIDAPMHMLVDGNSLAEVPIERFITRGVCLDVCNGFDVLEMADIREGNSVLLYYGFGAKYTFPEYFEDYPTLSEEVAQYLVEKKVNMVGSDTCSPDGLEDYPIHRLLLGADVLIIENLINLDKLVGTDFTVYAFPIALQLDAAPARVLADVDITGEI